MTAIHRPLVAPLATFALVLTLGGCEATPRFVAPTSVLEVVWHRHLTQEPLLEYRPQEFSAAETDGTRVWVGSSEGDLIAMRPRDGAVLWKRALGVQVASQPLFVEQERALYVGAQDGGLYALDADSGAQRWVYRVKGPIETRPVYEAGIIYFTSGENRVYAVDAARGNWKWQYDREAPESFTIRGYGGPLVHAGHVYVGFSDGYLAAISALTGEVTWARALGGDAQRFVDVDSTPVLYRGAIYVASYAGGLYALEPKDGSVRWRYEVEGARTVVPYQGHIYFTSPKEGLHSVDDSGQLEWRQALAGTGELSTPTLVGRHLLVSSAGGGLYAVAARSGRLEEYFAPGHGITAQPVSDGRYVYLMTNGGYFFALRLYDRGQPLAPGRRFTRGESL